jgi:hypothetical protein
MISVDLFSLCRFYTRKDGVAVARMVDGEFEYTYEYQGNAPKLVHTPLTDKCYLTLTEVSPSLISYFLVPALQSF